MPGMVSPQAHTLRMAIAGGLILLVFALLWFAALGHRDLNEPDEGRYAEIPREMVATGDWVTPHLDGLKYFEKPPLQYWATAVSYELFGQSNASARLWPVLLGFLTVPWVFFIGARLFDGRAAFCAACLLASTLMWVVIGHLNTLDMGVSAFMAFAVGALALAQSRRDNAATERNWMLFGWAMLAAAVLSKGLIGLVLPGAAVVLYSLWQRDWLLWRHLHIGKGLLLFLALTLPWFVAVSRANPDFLWFFFVHEHFLRYITPEAQRVQPWWYFLALIWLGFLPWVGSGFRALALPGFRWKHGESSFDATRLLWVYGVFVVVFFSLSDSKLVPYILPAYPAFTLLAGRGIARRGLAWADTATAVLLGIALLVVAFNLHWFARDSLPLSILAGVRPWAVAAGCLLLAAGAVAWRVGRRRLRILGFACLALLAFQCINWGYQALAPIYSTRTVARALAPLAKPGTPIYTVGFYQQSLPFYLGRTVKVVAYRGELGFGLDHAPGAGISDVSTFATIWRDQKQGLAVMKISEYDKLAADGLPMRVIYRDPQRVAVARR